MLTNEKARTRNRRDRSQTRTVTKKVLLATDKTAAQTSLKEAYDLIDRMTAKKVLHRNTAARRKARLARYVNALTD